MCGPFPSFFHLLVIVWAALFITTSGRRCPTDGVRAGMKGELSSPHFPEEYPHRISCEWIIFVPRGHHVRMEFTDFDLEYCMFCKCDYVEIRDGRNSTAPLLGKYCQSSKLKTISSTGRYLWVKFYSDVGGRFQGFRALYKAKKNGKTFKDPLHVTSKSGIIASPQSTASCGADRQCTWLVRAGQSRHVRIAFYNISLPTCNTPCGCSKIQVRDGTNESSRLMSEFCETTTKLENMCSTSRHLWVRFTYGPGIDLSKHGFVAKFEEANCRRKKAVASNTQEAATGTLDTVVGLLCASFTFMALMTLFMVCVASRKLARERRKQTNTQITQTALVPEIGQATGQPSMSPAPWPPDNRSSDRCDTCVYHTHVHVLYDSETETEYTDETHRYVVDNNRTPIYYCRHCRRHSSRPIAIL